MSSICERLHEVVDKSIKYHFDDVFHDFPVNGIYLLFEKGELSHGTDRIVRIGTHTGENQLLSRIKQHFINENKNRSIFRKNIGRCYLNGSPYLKIWDHNVTSRKNREKYSSLYDSQYEKELEKEISKCIQKNFRFTILPITEKIERLRLESLLIGTVSLCNECKPSENWLGLCNPSTKIKQSGLWQIQGLYGNTISECDIKEIAALINEERRKRFADRIKSEGMGGRPIRNINLVCRDCIYRHDDIVRPGNTSVCDVHGLKPNLVLRGGTCERYIKELINY
jgi:hypothetical protein